MTCDLLVITPHPDDAELHIGGTIAAQVRRGARVVLVDASRGELSSHGTPEQRAAEATQAAAILGVTTRENLGLPDGGITPHDLSARLLIIDCLRRHRPTTVICLSGQARHPDHQALAPLVSGAVKAAAFHRLATPSNTPAIGNLRLWYAEAELPLTPHFLVPLSDVDWEHKMAAIRCHASQFAPRPHAPTSINQPNFLAWIEARGRAWGQHAGAPYAEAFSGPELPRIENLATI